MERAVEAAEEDAEDAPSARRKTDSDYTWKGYDPGEISEPWHADHEAAQADSWHCIWTGLHQLQRNQNPINGCRVILKNHHEVDFDAEEWNRVLTYALRQKGYHNVQDIDQVILK